VDVPHRKDQRLSITRWHWGKIAIVWAWGGVFAALLLTRFLSSPANEAPILSAITFISSLGVLIALTAITWKWLGGKERRGD
jgi:hypothetical protein